MWRWLSTKNLGWLRPWLPRPVRRWCARHMHPYVQERIGPDWNGS